VTTDQSSSQTLLSAAFEHKDRVPSGMTEPSWIVSRGAQVRLHSSEQEVPI
jgi:hypothetical protein